MQFRERVHARVAPMIARVRARPLPAWAGKTGRFRPRLEQAWSKVAERWPSIFEASSRPASRPPEAEAEAEAESAPTPAAGSIDALLVGLEAASPGAAPLDPVSLDPLPARAEAPDTADATDAIEAIALVETLGTASSWELRREAAAGLARHTGDSVVDALVRAVRDPSAEVAIAAVASLARQADPRAAADLAEVLRDTAGFVSPFTRAAAVGAIAACQGVGALPMLLETLHDGDVEVSIAAVLSVAAIAPSESAKRLLALLEDRSGYYHPAVRLATAEALRQNGTMNSERALWLLATESDESVRAVLSQSAHQHP